jgi:hypothetical protein
MSTQSNPPRANAFAPLFRGVSSDQHMRVSDAERQAVTDRLAEHYGDGRLDQAEFDERVGRAMSAKTRADLGGLFDDLPESGAQITPQARPRRHGRPVLVLVLAVVVAVAAVHAVLWAAMPLLWLGLLVAAVLFVTRGVRHSRPAQGR